MDLRSKMRMASIFAAMAAAFGAALCRNPVLAAAVLVLAQAVAYTLAGAMLTPMKCPWPTGNRRAGDAKRWMLAALCGGGMGACALLTAYAVLSARFGVQLPAVIAIIGALGARACAVAVFNRRVHRPIASAACSAAMLGGVLICLYPLL